MERNAVVSAVGPVMISVSEHQYSGSDLVAVRATWRVGCTTNNGIANEGRFRSTTRERGDVKIQHLDPRVVVYRATLGR